MLPAMGLLLLLSTFVPPTVTYFARAGGFSSPALAQLTAFGVSILLDLRRRCNAVSIPTEPQTAVEFRDLGAIFTAIAYEIAQIAFTIFTAHTNLFHVYGALSTVLALLLWFYLLGNIFLYGAEISAVGLG